MSWLDDAPSSLVEDIAARMALRKPNKDALRAIAERLPGSGGEEMVCDLATGVGKTYITASAIEYLAALGVRNVLVVTPGTTIQKKTIANFTPGDRKYVPGAEYEPVLITSDNFARGQVGDALHDPDSLKLFVFNVQQLIKPGVKVSRRVRETDEFIGTGLYQHLQEADDLVVVADEHHVYSERAKAFHSAISDLGARALIGLTATPAESDQGKVVFRYTLAEAIADGYVKIPVIVYRQDGRKDDRTVLADAGHMLRIKAAAWHA